MSIVLNTNHALQGWKSLIKPHIMLQSPQQLFDQMAPRQRYLLCSAFAFVLVAFLLLQYFLYSGGKLTTSDYIAQPSSETISVAADYDRDDLKIYSNLTNVPLKHPQKVPDVSREWTFEKKKGVYFGRRHGTENIVIKTLVRDEDFKKFDSFICQNVTGTAECDVGDAIARSYIVSENAWTSKHLQETWKIVHTIPQL